MARYIDADKFREKAFYADTEADIVHYTRLYGYADVVPKSEVDRLQQALDSKCDNCICLARKMLDEETVREIEILRVRHLKRIDEAKQEVAREIFEEIDKILDNRFFLYHGVVLANKEDFAELKKKFVPDTNVGHKTESEDK